MQTCQWGQGLRPHLHAHDRDSHTEVEHLIGLQVLEVVLTQLVNLKQGSANGQFSPLAGAL